MVGFLADGFGVMLEKCERFSRASCAQYLSAVWDSLADSVAERILKKLERFSSINSTKFFNRESGG